MNPAEKRRHFLARYLWYYGHSKSVLKDMSLPELEQAYITHRIQKTPKTCKKVYGFIIPVS
jgi:hypothetical protein